jgi:RAB protein geranylgeranyltransferase component A
MSKKTKKINPYCPVQGCRTKTLHLSDPAVKTVHDHFATPKSTAMWIKHCIAEITESAQDDLNHKPQPRMLAYVLKWRQTFEMYHRALYVLFLAGADEIPHVVSGELPEQLLCSLQRSE